MPSAVAEGEISNSQHQTHVDNCVLLLIRDITTYFHNLNKYVAAPHYYYRTINKRSRNFPVRHNNPK